MQERNDLKALVRYQKMYLSSLYGKLAHTPSNQATAYTASDSVTVQHGRHYGPTTPASWIRTLFGQGN